ncbi:hypothetical protein ABZX85_50080 [Streptomyces sp. NPDC004539]|uniref:hypothetical protein n=1 Tax=Streptomyces sp. NPDC004539 TaxID=3154280 RepID=UPI0033AB37B2
MKGTGVKGVGVKGVGVKGVGVKGAPASAPGDQQHRRERPDDPDRPHPKRPFT